MLVLVLALVAAILAIIALIQSRGSALLAWAVLALAAIHLLPQLV
jgi:hypothetical protein